MPTPTPDEPAGTARSFTATAHHDGERWTIEVDGIGATQVHWLGRAESAARTLIRDVLGTGSDGDDFTVEWR